MAKKKAINQVGRPLHIASAANKALVVERVKHAIDQESIAAELGISENTLRKYYYHELKTGRTTDQSDIMAQAIKHAKEGDKEMIKYYLDRLGGREFAKKPDLVEISGPNGGAIPVQRFDFDAIPIEQTRYLEQVFDAVVVNEDEDKIE